MLELVKLDNMTLPAIANAIRAKTGDTDLMLPSEMPARIEAIETGGVNYLDYCTRFNLWSLNIFKKSKVELTLPRVTDLSAAFYVNKNASDTEGRRNTIVEELIIHSPNIITDMQSAFGQNNFYVDRTLKKIVMDFEMETRSWAQCFLNLAALTHIEGTPINLSSIDNDRYTSWMFKTCHELVEVRFKGTMSYSMEIKDSRKLSKDSIISLMACLSDEAIGKTLTLNQAAVNTAFETSKGTADGSTSAEWLALVEAHSNWTISLV